MLTFERLMIALISIFGVLLLWVLFVMLPFSLVAEAKCLEAGYPKSAVTWDMKRYCMNLDGSVTVKVDEI